MGYRLVRTGHGQQSPCALATPLTVRRSGREERRNTPESGQKSPWPRRWGLGRQGGAAPCVVTLCEHALGQLGSHQSFWREASRGPQSPRQRRRGDVPAKSLHCTLRRLGSPSLARPPGHSRARRLPTRARAGQAAARRAPVSFLSIIPPLPAAH